MSCSRVMTSWMREGPGLPWTVCATAAAITPAWRKDQNANSGRTESGVGAQQRPRAGWGPGDGGQGGKRGGAIVMLSTIKIRIR